MTTPHADLSRGMELLNRHGLNKGTAFTDEERTALGLHGLLPPQVESLDSQAARAYEAYKRKDDHLERHIYLRALAACLVRRRPTTSRPRPSWPAGDPCGT